MLEADGIQTGNFIEADGLLHRVRELEDEGTEKSAWYVLYFDGTPGGAYGSWRRNFTKSWSALRENDLSPQQLVEYRRRMEAAQRARDEELARRHEEAARTANELWAAASPADPAHPYLARKRVSVHGIRQLPDGRLIVPRQNEQGSLRAYQEIRADGAKKNQPGGEASGTFHLIGEPGTVIHVCEGYATGAAVHEATGQACAIAFSTHNLTPVGNALRRRYPAARLVFCADNDQWKSSTANPGVQAATAAAHGIPNAAVIVPQFRDTSTKPTDFNDLAVLEGIETVRRQLTAINAPLKPLPMSQWSDRSIPARRWVWDQWIPFLKTTALYGDGGVGKTLFAQQLATACAAGCHFLGQPVESGRVLGIFCEDEDEELARRQEHINRMLNLGFKDLEQLFLVSRDGEENLLMTFDGRDAGVLTGFWHQVQQMIEEIKPVLVIIDTAADTFGGNENIRPQVRQYVQHALTRLAKKNNCAILLCAHPSAAGIRDGSGSGGSTGWSNAVRSRLYLYQEEDTGRTVLARKKSNYAKKNETIDLMWHEGAFIPYQNGAELPTMERAVDQDFLLLLGQCDAQQLKVSHYRTSRSYAPRVFVRMGKARNLKWTQPQYEQAMERLLASRSLFVHGDARRGAALSINPPDSTMTDES